MKLIALLFLNLSYCADKFKIVALDNRALKSELDKLKFQTDKSSNAGNLLNNIVAKF